MLATGRAPFQEANDSETLTMILDCKYYLPSHVSIECNDLISRMLVREPEKRIKLDDIQNHLWLKEYSDEEDLTASDPNGEEEEDYADDDDDDEVDCVLKRRHDKLTLKENQQPVKRKKHFSSREKLFKKVIPLIKRENLSEENNNDIIENMVSGKIASKEEIIK